MARFDTLIREQPQRVAAMMRTGRQLEQLAARGDLMQIGAVLSFVQAGDLLPWFSVKMFKAACGGNHRDVMQFMVERGFDIQQPGVDPMHQVVAGWVASGGEVGAGPLGPTLRWLVSEGVDVNAMRRGDGWSALHVSSALQSLEASTALLAMGADVNCVALADVMPLHCAKGGEAGAAQAAAEAEAKTKAEAAAQAVTRNNTFTPASAVPAAPAAEAGAASAPTALVALLLAHGARPTWRLRPHPKRINLPQSLFPRRKP